jgi:hypothetical protein
VLDAGGMVAWGSNPGAFRSRGFLFPERPRRQPSALSYFRGGWLGLSSTRLGSALPG